jgi:hypothetical protein
MNYSYRPNRFWLLIAPLPDRPPPAPLRLPKVAAPASTGSRGIWTRRCGLPFSTLFAYVRIVIGEEGNEAP